MVAEWHRTPDYYYISHLSQFVSLFMKQSGEFDGRDNIQRIKLTNNYCHFHIRLQHACFKPWSKYFPHYFIQSGLGHYDCTLQID